ncbi:hypothetical protein Tsubulata_041340, partial [Turnera subulata]
MQILKVLLLPTSRHHLAGSCRYQQREKTTKRKQQLTMALGPNNVLGIERSFRPLSPKMGNMFSKKVAPIKPSWRAIPVRGREQDSKRAYLCSLLLHQARKFKDNCRMKCIGDHPFVAACSSDLRIHRGPQALLS